MLETHSCNKIINLPAFLSLLSALCVLINALGFVFVSQVANFFTIAVIIALTIKGWWCDASLSQEYQTVAYSLLLPITIVFIWATLTATNTTTFSYSIMVIVAIICSIVLFFRRVQRSALKYVASALYALITVPILLVALIGAFMPLTVETGRITEASPNGIFVLEAVQVSGGAIGGHTSVNIRRADSLNIIIGEIRHQPVTIHHVGRWSDFHFIEGFSWDGDYRLYMYRSADRHRNIERSVYAFSFVDRRWTRR